MSKKLFDFVIGNPPYQDSETVNNRSSAVYPFFYDNSEKIGDKYLLISPARFLFNTGLTSKDWNNKMLNDTHLKVEKYTQNSDEVFPGTDIKGGLVVIYKDSHVEFGAIKKFVPDPILRSIANKMHPSNDFPSIMHGGRSDLKFTDSFLNKHPEVYDVLLNNIKKKHNNVTKLSPNEQYELKSSSFDTLHNYFIDKKPIDDYENHYELVGLLNGKRTHRWILKEYMSPRYPKNNNISSYKVFVPESNGSGAIGEVLSTPMMSCTPTFISIGSFQTEVEAANLLKYIKTKFTRTMLGILKTTQHNPASTWQYVPLQNFTSNSDIDWSKAIHEIDLQLYKKYGLDDKEIEFIETHVKEME